MNKVLIVAIMLLAGALIWVSQQENTDQPTVDQTTVDSNTKKKPAEPNQKRMNVGKQEDINSDNSPAVVKEIISKIVDREESYRDRTRFIKTLRRVKMTPVDEMVLLEHLQKFHKDENYSVKNDILEHMIRYGTDIRQTGETMLSIVNDSRQSRVMREYVLQYFPEYYQTRWVPGTDWDVIEEEDRQRFNKAMWEMTEMRQGAMGGAALFALFKVADKYNDIVKKDVFEKSHEVLTDPSYMNPSRMGAVQILAFSNKEEHFETARKIAMSKEAPVLLQITAIHTASKSNDHDFIKYLQDIAYGKQKADPMVKRCAKLTLNNISKN